MLDLDLSAEVAERLGGFLAATGKPVARSNHWEHFGAMNQVSVRGRKARVAAGAGFDGNYELNFRARTTRERAGSLWRALKGASDERRHLAAFRALWPDADARLGRAARVLGQPMLPHKVGACQYFALLEPQLEREPPRSYLEIGAGSGYLAALMHAGYGARITVIDLPEILPLSFLYLHRLFPRARYAFGHECIEVVRDAQLRFLAPEHAETLQDGEFDLAANTASFGEMLPAEIARYFRLLRRVLAPRGRFFTVNRVEKWMNDPSRALAENRPGRGIAVRFEDYPWLPADEHLLDETSAIHQRLQPESPMRVRLSRLARA